MLQPQSLECTRTSLNKMLVLARKQLAEVCQFATTNFGPFGVAEEAVQLAKRSTQTMNLTDLTNYIDELVQTRDNMVGELSRTSDYLTERQNILAEQLENFVLPKFKEKSKEPS